MTGNIERLGAGCSDQNSQHPWLLAGCYLAVTWLLLKNSQIGRKSLIISHKPDPGIQLNSQKN
jgi:hypothetical protein